MKVGDLVQLSWGEHPRRAGIIIDIYGYINIYEYLWIFMNIHEYF